MIKSLHFLVLLLIFQTISAQNKLLKDLDGDKIKDTTYLDKKNSIIICKLSTQNFKKIESKPIEILNDQSGVSTTKSGFKFQNHWMRAGYENQFRYDKISKKIQLIGMSRYEFGPANNDGSGDSSVNLLTENYIGNWNYYNLEEEELQKIPTIKTKMSFPKIYLQDFSDETYFGFSEQCSALFNKHKKIELRKNK